MNKEENRRKMQNDLQPVIDILMGGSMLMIIMYFIHSNDQKGYFALVGAIFFIVIIIYFKILIKLGIGIKKQK